MEYLAWSLVVIPQLRLTDIPGRKSLVIFPLVVEQHWSSWKDATSPESRPWKRNLLSKPRENCPFPARANKVPTVDRHYSDETAEKIDRYVF